MAIKREFSTVPPGSPQRRAFIGNFTSDVSSALDIQPRRVKVVDLKAGSVIVIFDITPGVSAFETTTGAAITRLKKMAADPKSKLYKGSVTANADPKRALTVMTPMTKVGTKLCARCHPTGATCTFNQWKNATSCVCIKGFFGNGTACSRTDHCKVQPCKNGATCKSGAAGFTCACAAGWKGATCAADVDDCGIVNGSSTVCKNGGKCTDLGPVSFKCLCAKGWQGMTCATDTNECTSKAAPHNCHANAACSNSVGGFSCSCRRGYAGNGVSCVAVTCSTAELSKVAKHSCGASIKFDTVCVASCDAGKILKGEPRQLCNTTLPPKGQQPRGIWVGGKVECISLACKGLKTPANGRFTGCSTNVTMYSGVKGVACGFSCSAGYAMKGSGSIGCLGSGKLTAAVPTCPDADECASSPCMNKGSCTESTRNKTVAIDRYLCTCAAGYAGTRCQTDIDECASSPCLNGATCMDSSTKGSKVAADAFGCKCTSAFNGGRCRDFDECSRTPCKQGGTCTESDSDKRIAIGNYSCACLSGLVGKSCEVDVDDCASSPCINGGKCIDARNRYACSCGSNRGGHCEVKPPAAVAGKALSTSVTLTWQMPALLPHWTGKKVVSNSVFMAASAKANYSKVASLNAAYLSKFSAAGTVTYTQAKLRPCTAYWFAFSGTSSVMESARSLGVAAKSAPPVLTGLQLSSAKSYATSDSIGLRWTADKCSGLAAYKVYTMSEYDTEYKLVLTVHASSTTGRVSGLKSAAGYFFKAAASTKDGTGEQSKALQSAYTTPAAPAKVRTKAGSQYATTATIALAWTRAQGHARDPVTGYRIYAAPSVGNRTGPYSLVGTTKPQLAGTASKLVGGKRYLVRVAAVTDAGEGARSAPLKAFTAPRQMQNLATAGKSRYATSTSVRIAWKAGASDDPLKAFRVYLSKSEKGGYALAVERPAANTSATVGKLLAGGTYFVCVSAVNTAGEGDRSKPLKVYTAPKANAPATATAEAYSSMATVSLKWSASSADDKVTAYRVYQSIANGTFSRVAEVNGTKTTAVVRKLKASTQYFFRLTALNNAGEGAAAASTLRAFTAPLPVPTPRQVRATDAAVSIVWAAPATAAGHPAIRQYKVYALPAKGSKWTVAATVSALNATIAKLQGSQGYHLRVAAVTSAGEGGQSTKPLKAFTAPVQAQLPRVAKRPLEKIIFLTWSATVAADPVTGYVIFMSTKADPAWKAVVTTNATTSAPVGGLLGSSTYYFKALAFNSAGRGRMCDQTLTTNTGPKAGPTPEPINATGFATPTTITIKWQRPVGTPVKFFWVYMSTDGKRFPRYAEQKGTNLTASKLSPGKNYYFKIAAINKAGISGGTGGALAAFTTPTVCAAPVAARKAGSSVVFLKWSKLVIDAPVDGYHIYRATAAGGKFVRANQTATAAGIISALGGGKTHFFKVSAFNKGGEGKLSATLKTYTAPARMPCPKTALRSNYATEDSIKLSWIRFTADDPVTGYRLYMATSSTFSFVGSFKTLTATVGSLAAGKTYRFKLSAENAAGLGDTCGGELKAFTAPPAPKLALASLPYATTGTIRLGWGASSSDDSVTSYSVLTYAQGGTLLHTRILNATARAWMQPSLAGSSTYKFRILANNNAGKGKLGPTLTGYTAPAAVTGVSTASKTGFATRSTIRLKWAKPTSPLAVSQYRIFVSAPGARAAANSTLVTSAVASVTVSGLRPGMKYQFRVSAVTKAGVGDTSAAFAASTAPGIPGAARTATASNFATASSVKLVWDAVKATSGDKVTSYRVYAAKTAGGKYSKVAEVSKLAATVGGLTGSTDYYFKVSALSNAGEGTMSASALKTMTAPAPVATPKPATASGYASPTSIKLSWVQAGAGVGVTTYTVYQASSAAGTYKPVASVNGTSSSAAVGSLAAGGKYFFKVAAKSNAGSGMPSSTAGVMFTAPAAVKGAKTNAPAGSTLYASAKTARVAWTAAVAASPVTHYTLQFRRRGAASWKSAPKVKAPLTAAVLGGLEAGGAYDFRVQAANAPGPGAVSAAVLKLQTAPIAPPALKPSIKDNMTGFYATSTTMEVAWTGSNCSAWAKKLCAATSSFEILVGGKLSATVAAAKSSHTLTGLKAGGTYSITLRAVSSAGRSDSRAAVKLFTAPAAPALKLKAGAYATGSTLAITWTATKADSAAARFSVYTVTDAAVKNSKKQTAVGNTTKAADTSLTVKTLVGGKRYFLVMTASNAAGESDLPAAAVTAFTAPLVVGVARPKELAMVTIAGKVGLLGSVSSTTKVVVKWAVQADAAAPLTKLRYTLYQCTVVSKKLTCTTVVQKTTALGLKVASQTHAGLKGSTLYRAVLVAANKAGNSTFTGDVGTAPVKMKAPYKNPGYWFPAFGLSVLQIMVLPAQPPGMEVLGYRFSYKSSDGQISKSVFQAVTCTGCTLPDGKKSTDCTKCCCDGKTECATQCSAKMTAQTSGKMPPPVNGKKIKYLITSAALSRFGWSDGGVLTLEY